jgi:tungstate transport system substrate-binding protein
MPLHTALSFSRRSAALALGLVPVGGFNVAFGQISTGKELVVLTTTTTQDSGILKHIVEAFEAKSGLKVKTIVAGSGDILKQGARGEGDVLLTHSPAAEKEWMGQGHGLSRRLVMYNDFVIIGPPEDPAGVKGLRAADALKRIAEKKAVFVSRGDQSGTHVRELAMWKRAGIDPKGQSWYRETGQGQGRTMEAAMQQQGYAFTDRGTYLAHAKRLGLPIMVESDPALYNIYHVMPVDPAKFPRVNARGGQAFADYLVSPEGQQRIGEFGKAQYGRSLFTPAAGKTEEQLPN